MTAVQSSPLYDRLNNAFVTEPELASALLAAPPTERLPLLMFASVHYLLRSAPAEADAALAAYYPSRLDLRRGDLFDLLPAAVAEAPDDAVVVVLSSHVLPYLAEANRLAFAERVAELSETRELMLVLNEDHRLSKVFGVRAPSDGGYVAASLVDYTGAGAAVSASTNAKGPAATAFAKVDPHGSWLEWL